MNRKSLFIAGALLVAGLAGNAARAHQLGCWIQADRNVKIRNAAGTQASAAINDWNSMTILNISLVSSGEEIYVFNSNAGGTGWGSLFSITNYEGCIIRRAVVQINTYYMSTTSTTARGMYCQEIAHGFGLDHSNDGGCMGGGFWYDMATHYRPVAHNVSDIASMYADRVAASPAHPTPGPEADAPRLHAVWANNPRSLGETGRLATDIVVATVTDVTDGAPLVSRQKDGSVSRIPTQRVTFNVRRTRKGPMVAGESFVLFQNGNEHNRFSEDPSYEVGSRHLLFLTERGDGTYLVVSPQGRFEVTTRGLIPAARQGFAADLEGTSLRDVLFDVTQSLSADEVSGESLSGEE